MKILIINQYAGNKGDRAVAFFEVRELLNNEKVDKITLSTNNPSLWSLSDFQGETHKVKLIPWGWDVKNFNPKSRLDWERRRFMRLVGLPLVLNAYNKGIKLPCCLLKLFVNNDFLKSVKDSDVIISTGGHHLTTRFTQDLRGELLFDMLIAAMFKPLIFWSQTYGPFKFVNNKFERAVVKLLFNNSLYVRDLQSIEELKKLGVSNIPKSTYETVIGLENVIQDYVLPSHRKKKVGITIYNAEPRTVEEYSYYINSMAQFSDYLVKQGYIVTFFPHEMHNSVVNDRQCIKDIISRCKSKSGIGFYDEDKPTETHLKELSECQVFIGHKTHSIVFALTVGTPLLPIAYHPKTIDFLKQYDLEDSILNEKELSFESLKDKFDMIRDNMDAIGLQQRNRSREIGEVVRTDFSNLF